MPAPSSPASPALRALLDAVAAGPGVRVRTTGLSGAARAWQLAELCRLTDRPVLCVTVDEEAADALATDLSFFFGVDPKAPVPAVVRVPADEVLPWDELLPDTAVVSERLGALFHLARGAPVRAVVLSCRGLARRVLPPDVMAGLASQVRAGDEPGRDALARALAGMGYRNAPLVEDVGTFSLRGDILDVYPPLREGPVRLEFFGDTVESVRSFDPDTQRTIEPVAAVQLVPARELFFSEATKATAERALREAADTQHVPTSKVRERLEQVREGTSAAGLEGLLPGFFEGGLASVFDYLERWHPRPLVWLDEPTGQARVLDELFTEVARSHADAVQRLELTFPPDAHFLTREALEAQLARRTVVEGGGLVLGGPEAAPVAFALGHTRELREAIKRHHGEEGALTPLLATLEAWREQGLAAVIACGTTGQAERLKRLLLDREVGVALHQQPFAGPPPAERGVRAHLYVGEVSAGFIDPAAGLAVLSDEDIFGAKARRPTRRRRPGAKAFAAGFKDLQEGDLCVHADFGVCRYAGLVTMPVQGVAGDFLVLEFAGKDKVYLPVARMRLVSKFTGADQGKVSLDKLGTTGFDKRKAQVKEQLLKMAAELLTLYAQRKANPGHAFNAPDRYFHQFEADFEFEETPDQQKAIDDVLADMQRPAPMDRLVCGDVGYGKTEVAMRAAFKAVLDRKQVAVLVPTTLLAHQHFASFKRRFDGYPVSIEVLSSLQKLVDAKDVLRRAREGRVDIVIGTHKLLASDVAFKDLGLLVLDEEQKFGVKQKEALKRLKTSVDTLTLSATPIPRTLNMAMSGLRDMTLITTPPAERKAIRTFVNPFDELQITEAITRELARGGQVYFVHNRVQSIHSMEKLLHRLLPKVKVAVAHGQMGQGQLERVMAEFVEKRAQVLLATSIIESGLDIASANTLIVNRADHFGLSQLYQLRGRVGRSKERAYAYLLVPKGRAITKDAERRLEVLQTFTELGAGFTIASHDLELRGAGSLLGREQSGSIEAVGFDLYAQLLEEAIAEVRGEPPTTQLEPDVNLPLPAYLPEAYVPDVHQRLVLYKRYAQATSADELADLRTELTDRFGDVPPEVEALEEVMLLKLDLRRLQVRALDAGPGRLVVTLGAEARLDGAKVAALVQRSKGFYRLTPELKLVARVDAAVKGAELMPVARKVVRDLLGAASSALDR